MKILFVCTGNTCRSPMAENLFRKELDKKNIKNVDCDSAGISTNVGLHASENAIKACKEFGIDLSAHMSKPILDMNLNNVDLFVVMTKMHAAFLQSIGIKEENIYILGSGICDPYGGDIETYRRCRDQICENFKDLFCKLNLGNNNDEFKNSRSK